MKLTKKQQNILFWTLFIGTLGGGVGLYFYLQGKKQPTFVTPPDEGGGTLPDPEIQQIASSVYADMKGVNVFGHNVQLWTSQVTTLSNTDFVRLYNAFNSKYQPDSGQTFTQWVQNETNLLLPQWTVVQQTVLNRCASLNLP